MKKKRVIYKIYKNGYYIGKQSVTANADASFWNICEKRIRARHGAKVEISHASLSVKKSDVFLI